MGRFGLSFVGASFLMAFFVPNMIWAVSAKSEDYDPHSENRGLRAVERIGQVLTVTFALVFTDTNLRSWSQWMWWLVAAVVLMVVYEAAWIRYFTGGRTTRDFYSPFLGVPLPLATVPVAAFVLLGVYGRFVPLIAATVVLGIGHIGIHRQHYRALRSHE